MSIAEDMTNKPLEEWNPKTRVQMDAYRKRLVDIITPAAVSSINYLLVKLTHTF
jgi:translation initiation factor 3 subunit J